MVAWPVAPVSLAARRQVLGGLLGAFAFNLAVNRAAWANEAGLANDSLLEARAWLQRLAKATTTVNYQGTMVIASAGRLSSSRLTRYCVGPERYEISESLDGPARVIYRHNELVHTLWLGKQVAVVEQRESLAPFSSGHTALPSGYDFKLDGTERVAGRRAQVLRLTPKDATRFAQRIWADVSTGLMLRADVLDADGRALESSAFSDIRLGIKPQVLDVTTPMHKLDGFRVVRAALRRTKLEEEGWRLQVPVPGFVQVSCVSRPVDGGEPTAGGPTIVQTIFSDGLVHVSLFIEPYDVDRHKPLMSSWGATHALAERRNDRWVTIMGDVPIETIKRFAAALEPLQRR